MGHSASITQSTPQITDRSWSFIAEPSSRSSCEPNQRAKKTVTVTSMDELNILKDMFDFRLKNKDFITHCYGFEVIDLNENSILSKFTCQAPFSSIKVNFHYEQITAKFSDIYQIPIQQGLKLLSQFLKGYSILYDQFGYFTPESRQINKQGNEWKVWISQNIFALKSKSKQKSIQNQVSKQRFLQQAIHLFDVLRDDEEPEFSYSVFIYGKVKTSQFLPSFQLDQILGSLNQTLQNQNSVKKHHHRASLRRVTLTSNQTVRMIECDTLISFDEKCNDATLPKFNDTKIKSFKKSLNESVSMKNSQKQNVKMGCSKTKCETRHQSFNHGCVNSNLGYNSGQKSMEEYKHELSTFKRVSSKLIHGTMTNNYSSEHEFKRHYNKNKSSALTPSNCTGWTKSMNPLQMLSKKLNREMAMHNGSFVKKQRSYTMDFVSNGSGNLQEEIYQVPIKITENSEVNSESQQIDFGNKNFDQAFLPSDRSDKQQQSEQLGPAETISKNPTSHNSPSIAHKTKICGKQTMKLLKEYLLIHSKGEHKRSLTDPACLQTENKIKYCWSQEFDSEFDSVDSKTPRKPEQNSERVKSGQKEHMNERKNKDERSNLQMGRERKQKQVTIKFNDGPSVHSYNRIDSDRICEKSNMDSQSENSNGPSLGRLPIFRSECFKGLLGNSRLNTLKSIKQIQVDYPIDEEILNDMNKMFTKHRFAKSTKQTQLQQQQQQELQQQ